MCTPGRGEEVEIDSLAFFGWHDLKINHYGVMSYTPSSVEGKEINKP